MRGVESTAILAPPGPVRGGGANLKFIFIFFKQKGVVISRAACPSKPTRS